jgi:serine/threonine-protein kinase RsbW
MDHAITVSVPARTGFVHVVRAVTAGVAARLDFSIEDIEDLRLAVDEAAAHLLMKNPSSSRLTVRLTPRPGELEVVATGDDASSMWPDEAARDSMSWHVLLALTDGAAMEMDGSGPAIRFTKSVSRAGSRE